VNGGRLMEQAHNQISVIKPKPFPQALFSFREYDGAKVLTLIIFILSILYFGSGLWKLFGWTNKFYVPDIAVKTIYFSYHFFIFITVYCFTCLVFDKRGIEGYVLSIFSTILGAIYIFSPIDFVPDIIPFVGTLDDVFIGSGSIILGVSSWYKNKRKNEFSEGMLQLVDEKKYNQALEIMLKKEGYAVKR
jgi:hypothetical protein